MANFKNILIFWNDDKLISKIDILNKDTNCSNNLDY